MKRYVLVAVMLSMAMGAFAQSDAVADIKPADLDLRRVDLSRLRLFFQGPLELYVSGVSYGGDSYSAILSYDGGSKVEVKEPSVATTQGKPRMVDMSQARLRITQTGLRLENVIADGRLYSGDMEVTSSNELVVRSLIPGDRVPSTAELNSLIAALEADVRQRDDRIARLDRQLATTGDAQAQEMRRQVNALENQIQQKNTEIARLQAGPAATPDWATASSRLSRSLLSGFDRGKALTGQWRKSAASASQTDSGRLNAKLTIPLSQDSDELLYSFSGSATGTGWRGFGLHILGSGVKSNDSYGFGQSYLVWVTRDPVHYQNPQTYVQIYRSFDDVHMVELTSKAVDVPIATSNQVAAYVNRSARTVTVVVNGQAVFSFSDPNMIRSGSQMAVRTLGAATVTGLEVRSR